jgi:hypothetical protein
MGAAGRRLQRERFTERAHVEHLLAAYRRTAAAAGSRR